MGCPNIQAGASVHMGDVQTYRGTFKHMWVSKGMRAHRHLLSLTKHAFFVLCVVLVQVTEVSPTPEVLHMAVEHKLI